MNSSAFSETVKPTPAKLDKPHYIRKSGSSVKRQSQPWRTFHIRPLPFEKELEEITNEPLPEIEFFDDESEDSTNGNPVATKEREIGAKVNNADCEPQLPTEKANHDSFDLDFGTLSLETPVKTRQINQKEEKPTVNGIVSNNELVKRPDYQFVTPKYNKILPNAKVQCSVNVKSWLPNSVKGKQLQERSAQKPNTHLPTACLTSGQKQSNRQVLHEIRPNVLRSIPPKQPDKKVQCSILPAKNLFDTDHTFERIRVHDVEYIVLNLLGRGGSSQVFHCYDLRTKSNRAIKCVSLSNPDSADGYINEVKLLQKLQNCDKIIKMYDFEIKESEKSLLVVLEMGGADLARILKELAANTSHVPLYVLLFYWMEMLYAVRQIHSHGIIHSDLKPANFLKAEGGLMLIDFGIATCIQSDMTSVLKPVPEGSFNYISPEAIVNETNDIGAKSPKPGYKISYKSDVWSLGCILYQLVYRKTPFQHITNTWKKLSVIGDSKHVIEYPSANWVPLKVIETIKQCLRFEMRSRPSVNELIAEYENVFNHL